MNANILKSFLMIFMTALFTGLQMKGRVNVSRDSIVSIATAYRLDD
jgi:hypothetical protein